jgi:hypothetical protein
VPVVKIENLGILFLVLFAFALVILLFWVKISWIFHRKHYFSQNNFIKTGQNNKILTEVKIFAVIYL